MPRPDVVVLGQIARDLAVAVRVVPEAGGSADVTERRELLGGKGSNIAVALSQLGLGVALIGVVGDDQVGDWLLDQLSRDGIDVRGVLRRRETTSALMIDVVTPDGRWRYLESVPTRAQLTAEDVGAQRELLQSARTVVLQLQQPAEALVAAVASLDPGCRVVLDGAATTDDQETRHRLLAAASVLRCDAREAELWARRTLPDLDSARSAAAELLAAGPELVVLAVGDEGNLAVWADGSEVVPLSPVDVVDATGGGDAFVAGLTWSLVGGADPVTAVHRATTASGQTVGHLAGRPDLSSDRVAG